MIDSATLYRWREAVMEAAVDIVVHDPDCDGESLKCDAATQELVDELNLIADEMLEAYLDAVRRETSAA